MEEVIRKYFQCWLDKDKLVVRYEVVNKVFGRVGKLRRRLLHFYLFGQVYECARKNRGLQGGLAER